MECFISPLNWMLVRLVVKKCVELTIKGGWRFISNGVSIGERIQGLVRDFVGGLEHACIMFKNITTHSPLTNQVKSYNPDTGITKL